MSDLTCSARGCRAPAAWGLLWNNPKLHSPDRRKVWLACEGHREHLEQFLGRRGFHLDTVAVDELDVPEDEPHVPEGEARAR